MADETPTPQAADPQPTPEPAAPAAAPEPQYVTRDDFARLERSLATLAQNLPAAQPVPQTSKDLSDDDLWAQAQQGNRVAFEMYMERIAERKSRQTNSQDRRAQLVQTQLQALLGKYPELVQNGHALNTRYQQFFAAFRQMGEPDVAQTYLDAALRAVADSRDVIGAKPTGPARSPSTGQFAPSHREPDRTPQAPAVSAAEADLARKMGVKDAAKAKAKFWERNGKGLNSVSPNVAAALQMSGEN